MDRKTKGKKIWTVVSLEVLHRLQQLAVKENRSVCRQVAVLLEKAVEPKTP